MSTITARLDEWLDREIRAFWRLRGEGPSSGMRRLAREWWVLQELPLLEFRDGVVGRRPGVRGGPDVWEIVLLAREGELDPPAIVDYLAGDVPVAAIEQALEYAARFPDEIEEWLTENERVGKLLSVAERGE